MKCGWVSLAILVLAGCSDNNHVNPGTWDFYRNPVELSDVQDPTIYYEQENGKFYLFASGAAQTTDEGTFESVIPIMESSDLKSWQQGNSAFEEGMAPSYDVNAPLGCPSVAKVDGRYLLYYSLSEDSDKSCIAVASADIVTGPYVGASGQVLLSSSENMWGVSSPSYIKDGNDNWLVFGNFNGIYLQKLSSDGLRVSGSPIQIASTDFDAPQIFVHEGKYYLFATIGTTAGGESSECTQVVARADSIDGEYCDRNGNSVMKGYSELLIGNSTKFAGIGHGCVFDVPDGSTWILYNAYDLSNIKKGRTLMLDRVEWIDGWPSVRGQIPSFCADTPVLNK